MTTPALELDLSLSSSSSPLFSNSDTMASSSACDAHISGGQGGPSGSKYSNGPHIRSRITVVCAECKRLKLKCDRRTPCSSCLKRDTVQRCVYSQAAAEKIDVQSLHNRLLVVEGHLAQLTSSSASTLGSIPPFKSSYPVSTPPQPFCPTSSQRDASSAPLRTVADTPSGFCPSNDHALLVTGSSGSSVIVSLDDTASIWLNEVDTQSSSDDFRPLISPHTSARPGSGAVRVKLEPTPSSIPSSAGASSSTFVHSAGSTSGFVPPVPFSVFIPVSDSRLPRGSSYPSTDPSSHCPDTPQVTPALLRYLPSSPNIRSRYTQSLTELMLMYPCLNVQHFERRVEAMLSWGETNDTTVAKRDLARELFLGGGRSANPKKAGNERKERGAPPPPSPKPTLSFFAATCAAFALGALMAGDTVSESSVSTSSTASTPGTEDESVRRHRTSPAALFALSEQALGLSEKTSVYDVDSVVAMLLQVLFMLHDGQMRVGQTVFPLVGKMVNVARMMGLAVDPDEFVGTYSLFEAETRRRVWWDVFCCDLLVSECMGQQPLILENSFTTRIPADVDEDKFSPSSTIIPPSLSESGDAAPTYLSLKCRLAQLVKSIRRQVARDVADDEVSIEQAASGEAEISSWLTDLPPAFRLNMDSDITHPLSLPPSTSPFLMAQRCELVIAANRVVLKLYMPFMKEGSSNNGSKPSHQALMGTINAAHAVVYAARVLHGLWRDTRPAALAYYDFGRALFDAAVVCAYAVIQQPKSILVPEAVRGLAGALEVMRAVDGARMHAPSGAVRVVEAMKDKAERARAPREESNAAGTKRKRQDSLPLRETPLAGGFQLPYVGPSVNCVRPEQSRVAPLTSKIAAVAGSRRDSQSNPHEPKALKSSAAASEKERERERKREKEKEKQKYPSIGIRVRSPPLQDASPTGSVPSGNHCGGGSVNGSMHSPVSPPDRSQQSSTLSSHSGVAYQYPLPSAAPIQSQQRQEPPPSSSMMHDFQIEFHNPGPPSDPYHGSFASHSSPESSNGYEHAPPPPSVTPFDSNPQQQQQQQSQSFHTPAPPSSQDYYLPQPSYTPNPSRYDQSSQSMGLSTAFGMPPPIDTTMSSIPGTPRDSYHMLADKAAAVGTHFDAQVGKSELDRQLNPDYPQTATSHGLAMTATAMSAPYVQGWRPPPPQQPQQQQVNQSWEYKFYNPHA